MNDEKAFLYSVNPRRIITEIEGAGPIRVPKSLYLTRKDVDVCLKKATVYRRFAAEGRNERVTIGNADRLHNERFIDESEWEAYLSNELSKDHGTVKVTEESKPAEEEKVTEPVSVEENKEPEAVEDNVVETENATTDVEESLNTDEEDVVESDDEEIENSPA